MRKKKKELLYQINNKKKYIYKNKSPNKERLYN